MVNKISLWGIIAVVMYLVLVGWAFYTAANCSGTFCGAVIIIAVIPWSIIFEDGINLQFLDVKIESDNMLWFWTAVIINILILYFLFSALQKWMQKPRF